MKTFFKSLSIVCFLIIFSFAGYALISGTTETVLGAGLPSGVAVFETALQSPITSSATSMSLTQNSVRGGGTLSGFQCFTVDEGSTQAEYICGSISGTNVTSLVRGVDPQTATTTNALLQFSHRRGANVKITDFPLIQILRNQINGTDTIPNLLNYSFSPDFSNASTTAIVSYGLLQQTSFAGTVNANESTKGISEFATQIEMASTTSFGSTGAGLVLQARYSTSSPQIAGLYIPVTRNDGKLSPQFIATSTGDAYNFAGPVTLNSQNNIIASSTQYQINAGTIYATSSINTTSLTVGSSTVTFLGGHFSNTDTASYSANSNSTSATSTALAIPSLTASSTIQVYISVAVGATAGNTSTCRWSLRTSTGQVLADVGPLTGDQNTETGYIQYTLFPVGSNQSQRVATNYILTSSSASGLTLSNRSFNTATTFDFSTPKSLVINILSGASNVNTCNTGAISVEVFQ